MPKSQIPLYSHIDKPKPSHKVLGKILPPIFSLAYDLDTYSASQVPAGPLVVATGPHETAIDVGYALFNPALSDRTNDSAIVVKETLQEHPILRLFQQIPAYREKAEEGVAKEKDLYYLSPQECELLGIPFTGKETLNAQNRPALLRSNTFKPVKDWLSSGKTVLVSVEGTRFPKYPEGALENADLEAYQRIGISDPRLDLSPFFEGPIGFARSGKARILPVYTQAIPGKGGFGRKKLAVYSGHPFEPGKDKEKDIAQVRYQLLSLQAGLFQDGTFPDYSSFKGFFNSAWEKRTGELSSGSPLLPLPPFPEALASYKGFG